MMGCGQTSAIYEQMLAEGVRFELWVRFRGQISLSKFFAATPSLPRQTKCVDRQRYPETGHR
jgi:hypothetical protein